MPGLKTWRSIPLLFGDATLTEKLDGHTVGIHIEERTPSEQRAVLVRAGDVAHLDVDGKLTFYRVGVQNRNRWLTPGSDVRGVAQWAKENAAGLAAVLGPGRHFGEWW